MKFSLATTTLLSLLFRAATSMQPPGDECASAIVVPSTALPYNQVFNVSLYSNNENDPIGSCNFGNEGSTFWLTYTPTFSGLLRVEVTTIEGTDAENVVSLFQGRCSSLRELQCNDQDFGVETVFYVVKSGVTYTIKVGEGGDGICGFDGIDFAGLVNFTLSQQRDYFNLFDEDEEKTVGPLNDVYNGVYPDGGVPPSTINYANPIFGTTDYSIIANFANRNVESVRLQLDNQPSVCDNDEDEPKIYGESNNEDIAFAIGNRVIRATAYSRNDCRGNVLGQISQEFFVKGCDYIQYGLYDARRDIYLSNLHNASNVPHPPCQVNVGVTFTCGFVPSSVRLELRRASDNVLIVRRDERSAPYLLFSDDGRGNILPGSIPAGEYKLTASINNVVHPSVTFSLGTCSATPAVDNTFDIDLRFSLDELSTYENAALFPPIAKRVSSLVIGDKPDFTNTSGLTDPFCGDLPSRVDDLLLCTGIFDYTSGNLPGILGFYLSTFTRPSDRLPFAGAILFDTTNFQNQLEAGEVENYILQQLTKTLGLGESWSDFGLSTSRSSPCSYNGTKAKAEFEAITGCSANIPLDELSIPSIPDYDYFNCLYWDPACLPNDVLTFNLGGKKISRVTLGALEDLGYVVNYTAADPFDPSDIGTCAGCGGGRYLKSSSTVPKSSSCYSGDVHERAVRHGRKVLRDVHDHHMEHTKTKPLPENVVFIGNQRITVMYQHEDGTLCSIVVPADFWV